MDNVLFSIGHRSVYAYGFMLSLGILSATVLVLLEGRRVGLSSNRLKDIIVAAAAAFLLAGQLGRGLDLHGYTIFLQPRLLISVLPGGLDVLLGASAAVATAVAVVGRKGMRLPLVLDIFSPPLALLISLVQLGSDVFGEVTSVFWAVDIGGITVHPTQLYLALGFYLVFYSLWSSRKKTVFAGQMFLRFIFWSGAILYLVNIFRPERQSSLYLAALVIAGIVLLTKAGQGPMKRVSLWGSVGRLVLACAGPMLIMIIVFYARVL